MTKEYGRMRFVLMVALVAGCSTKPNPKSCLDNHCSDPELPFCDVDGSIGGEPNTCIAVECTPNEFEECRGDRALTCNATGDSYDLVQCEFGCGETGCKTCDTPECEKHIIPKYVPTACDTLAGLPEFKVSSDRTINTSNELECVSVVPQTTGPDLCVLRYGSITIERNQTLTVTGSRALAMVADRSLLIDGVLDVSGSSTQSGPGGGTVISGADVNAGGGAGGKHPGGSAGDGMVAGGAGNGGATQANPTTLAGLVGGAASSTSATGSNGGGAVTLISCRGDVSIPGLIDAGGGGGARGFFVGQTYHPPNGGGAGGTIVLQGMTVSITGETYANGGGGGSGGSVVADNTNGFDGPRSTAKALGGGAGTSGGASGGRGGNAMAPEPGAPGPRPGAGGGSAGFILTYTPELVFPSVNAVGVSPGLEPPGHVATN